MRILTLEQIKAHIDLQKIISMQEEGFKAFSEGRVNVPPVAHIKVSHTPVRYHIKYGVIDGDDVFVVKLAGGLEQTTEEFGPAKIEGMMLVISAKNGKLLYLLQDEGYLTNLRTAVAGLISAKYLAPKEIQAIGVLGTGTQARMQVEILKRLTKCRNIFIWGRNIHRVSFYKSDLLKLGFIVHVCTSPTEVAQNCNLIITTTASSKPLLKAIEIQTGTHITAVGADSPGKQELDPEIFKKADIVIVDSKSQCIEHGEIHNAYQSGILKDDQFIELGQIIANPSLGRMNDHQISVIDLTGVAVQDIQIAKAVIASFEAVDLHYHARKKDCHLQ